MLAFLQSSFPPQVPVKHHVRVQAFRPEHAHPCLGASLPEKVKARNTQSRLESSMRHGFPCTNVLSFASSWECLWVPGSTYTYNLRSCVTPSNRKWGLSFPYVMWSVHRWEKKYGSPQTFTLSIFLSLVIKLGWSRKGASQKQLVIKVWAEGNWGTN